MNTDTDENLRAAAERFVSRFGGEAPDQAHMRAVELARAGHDAEAAEWEAIATLAEGLLARPRRKDEPLH